MEVLHLLSKNFPEMLIGAGAVLSVEQSRNAINSGAGPGSEYKEYHRAKLLDMNRNCTGKKIKSV